MNEKLAAPRVEVLFADPPGAGRAPISIKGFGKDGESACTLVISGGGISFSHDTSPRRVSQVCCCPKK